MGSRLKNSTGANGRTRAAAHVVGACALALLLAAPAGATPMQFFDGTFDPADWAKRDVTLRGASPSGSASQRTTGGNPGAYRHTIVSVTGNEGMRLESTYLGGVYEPAVHGAIDQIDYSEDAIQFTCCSTSRRMLLEQDGNTFFYALGAFRSDDPPWQTREVSGLRAINFFNEDDPNLHPDFSVSGSPIHFGFTRTNFVVNSAGTANVNHGIDNWTVTVTPGEVRHLVPAGSRWKYLDDGSNQRQPTDGVLWFGHPDYDDSLWESGNGELGYGDGNEVTEVGFGGDPNNKHVTTYFRRTFDVVDVSTMTDVTLSLLRDDGAAVYLNGERVALDRLDPDAPFNRLATNGVSNANEFRYLAFLVDAGLLVEGRNVLAAEIHQVDVDSTDISFDLQLTARVVPEPSSITLALLGAAGLLLLARRRK